MTAGGVIYPFAAAAWWKTIAARAHYRHAHTAAALHAGSCNVVGCNDRRGRKLEALLESGGSMGARASEPPPEMRRGSGLLFPAEHSAHSKELRRGANLESELRRDDEKLLLWLLRLLRLYACVSLGWNFGGFVVCACVVILEFYILDAILGWCCTYIEFQESRRCLVIQNINRLKIVTIRY